MTRARMIAALVFGSRGIAVTPVADPSNYPKRRVVVEKWPRCRQVAAVVGYGPKQVPGLILACKAGSNVGIDLGAQG